MNPIVHSFVRITFHKVLQSSYIRVLAHFLVILQGQHVCICLGLILELLEWNAAACNQNGNTNKLYVMILLSTMSVVQPLFFIWEKEMHLNLSQR
jgi:hypothetical protein